MPDPVFAPIELTLYGENDEPKKTYVRTTVRFGILKKVLRLAKEIPDINTISEEHINAMSAMVVEVFGDQFTVDELEKGADVSEMMTVLQAIQTRASALVLANPTVPPATNQKKS